jgi:ADP-ribose pyrophosphatase YjhB (NUDIX family)
MYELGVRAILKDKRGRVLLVKNVRGVHAGKWVLPGGKVEKGEYAEDGIKREVLEELNLVFNPKFIAYHQDIQSDPNKKFLTLFFMGKFIGIIKRIKKELTDYKFFTSGEIEKITILVTDTKR